MPTIVSPGDKTLEATTITGAVLGALGDIAHNAVTNAVIAPVCKVPSSTAPGGVTTIDTTTYVFLVGDTQVTCTATDNTGTSAPMTFRVRVGMKYTCNLKFTTDTSL